MINLLTNPNRNKICNQIFLGFKYLISVSILFQIGFAKRNKVIRQNNPSQFSFEIITTPETIGDLGEQSFLIGIPNQDYPTVSVQYQNPVDCPFDCASFKSKGEFWVQTQKVQGLNTATLVISPMAQNGKYYQTIHVDIHFDEKREKVFPPNQNQSKLLAPQIMNWDIAKNWVERPISKRARSASFPEGTWLSFSLEEDEIKSIEYNALLSAYSELESADPRSFSLYTGANLGRAKSQASNMEIEDNLVEISLDILGEDDGSFDSGDKIIFYGHGPSGFDNNGSSVSFNQNLYFTKNTYYLFIPNDNNLRGQRIETASVPNDVTISLDYGISYIHQEVDLVNPANSGLGWASSPIAYGGTYSLNLNILNPKPTVDASIQMGFLGGELVVTPSHNTSHQIKTYFNSTQNAFKDSISWSSVGYNTASFFLDGSELSNGINSFFAVNTSNYSNSRPFFDYFNLKYGRQLSTNGNYDFYALEQNLKIRFSLEGAPANTLRIWDISEPESPKSVTINPSTNQSSFDTQTQSNSPSHYIVFQSNDIASIFSINNKGSVNFSILRKESILADHIIIAPESYRESAQSLLSLRSPAIYASLEDIFREFSAGNPDPMAIRNFIQWTQEYWQSPKPYSAFLIGDADFDYRNITGESETILPTIEVGITGSWATDDRLATIYGAIPEIALGRFPARSIAQFESFIEKILMLEAEPELGPWRQRVTLLADDGARPENDSWEISTGKSHTNNSEAIAELIPPTIEINKLYMLEYPEESDVSIYGVVKPEATKALMESISTGTAIISYIGHGSPTQLAQERLLYLERGDIQTMNPGKKLPVWIVGTCSFGHFDDVQVESFAEELVRAPMNGASAVISTTRIISVNANANYTGDLFSTIFNQGKVTNLPIGSILRSVKTGNKEGEYFTLFGDPAMKLPMPADTLSITTINPDTIETLALASFSGQQTSISQNGTGIVTLRDAERTVTREYNFLSTIQSITYTLPGPLLFRGQFSFAGENFDGNFRVPLDISYSDKNAKMNIYIYDEDGMGEALGNKSQIPLVGGDASSDHVGPIISFESEDGRILSTGDHLGKGETMRIRLTDALGINLTNEIGHEITITNATDQSTTNITNDFIYDVNSITTGTLPYIFDENETEVRFIIKAWDSANNSSEKELLLNLTESENLSLYNIFNYPNPFDFETQFTFEINQSAEITLSIFTLGGRKIKTCGPTYYSAGYHFIDWDGRDAFGGNIANGVYLYRIQAEVDGIVSSSIGRIAKFR